MTDLGDLHFLGLSVKLFAASSCCVSECFNWVSTSRTPWQVKQVDFFCEQIVTIKHELDTLSITVAPVLLLIDDAIITCELSEFFPTSEDELSGLVKKIAAKSRSLDPVTASLLRYCIVDLIPIIKGVVNLSFNSASMSSSVKNAVLSPLLKKPSLDFEIFSNFRPRRRSNSIS